MEPGTRWGTWYLIRHQPRAETEEDGEAQLSATDAVVHVLTVRIMPWFYHQLWDQVTGVGKILNEV